MSKCQTDSHTGFSNYLWLICDWSWVERRCEFAEITKLIILHKGQAVSSSTKQKPQKEVCETQSGSLGWRWATFLVVQCRNRGSGPISSTSSLDLHCYIIFGSPGTCDSLCVTHCLGQGGSKNSPSEGLCWQDKKKKKEKASGNIRESTWLSTPSSG